MLAVKELEGTDEAIAKDLDEIFDKVLVPDDYPVNVAILLAALKLLRNDLQNSNVKVTGREADSKDQSLMSTSSCSIEKAINEVKEMISKLDNEGKTYSYLSLKMNIIDFYVTHFIYDVNEDSVQEFESQSKGTNNKRKSGTQHARNKRSTST
jgi:hypothetical protein